MAARLTLDDAAWTNRWRHRSTAEKAVLALGLLAVALTTGPVGGIVVSIVATLAAIAAARVPVRTWAVAIASPLAFTVIALVAVAVTLDAPSTGLLWSAGPFAVTEETWGRAVEVFFRALGGASCLLLLATTTPMPYLLGSAARVPGLATLADLAGVVYRMVFGLLDAQARIRESQASRLGFRTSRAARHSMGMLAGAVFIRAWNQAHRLELGLAGRGYAGGVLASPVRRTVDRRFLAVSLAVTAAVALVAVVAPDWPR